MPTIKITGIYNEYDIEVIDEMEEGQTIEGFVSTWKQMGLMPRPRFSGTKTEFEPFKGVVEKVEETTTKKGDKQMFIAHVRPDKAEGEKDPRPLFAVKYMPPKNTWRVGDRVFVEKSEKGWPELHEEAGEPPF